MRVRIAVLLSTTLLFIVVVLAVAQGMVTVVYPNGSTRTIPKTPYIETDILYVGKYAMRGEVIEIAGPTVIHVKGVGYVKLADILVPAEKSEEAKEFLSNLLLGKQVYLDIDDKNIIDQSGRISAVVYLPINNTTVLNVNFELVVKGYAYIFNEANEFNPSQWVLEEKITAETATETTTTTTTAPTATTTTIIVTSVIPIPTATETSTPPENETLPPNQTVLPTIPSGGEVVVIEEPGDNNPPPPPPIVSSPPANTITVSPRQTTVTKTVLSTVTVTYTTTTTIQRYLTFTLTAEGELPFHATPLGISLIAALSALLGSLVTIALLRKYITT